MKKISLTLGLVFLAAIAGRLYAQDATSQPTTGESVLTPSDTEKLTELSGKPATVKGEISGSYAGAKTILILNFKESRNFNVIIRKEDLDAVNAAFSNDVAATLKGKTITVTGDVSLYKEKPQIQVTKPEQIQVESK